MSTLFLHQLNSIEPMPNSTQESDNTPDIGTYSPSKDCNLTQGTASSATNRANVIILGNDDNLHYTEESGWISFQLASGSTGSGTFSATLYADISAVPVSGVVTLKAKLFKWLANDSLSGAIGSAGETGNLTTTVTAYNFTFATGTSVSYSDNDRFYMGHWYKIQDAVSLGEAGIYTLRVRYDSSTRNSSFTVPGTQSQYVYNRILPSAGAGI